MAVDGLDVIHAAAADIFVGPPRQNLRCSGTLARIRKSSGNQVCALGGQIAGY
jgi:hypothetical protein